LTSAATSTGVELMPLSPRTARLVRQSGYAEQELRRLCRAAVNNEADAMKVIHKLAAEMPEIRPVLANFGRSHPKPHTEGHAPVRKKMGKIKGSWKKIQEGSSNTASFFSGGLPGLGKRR
jgi:hypothetical protein